MRKYKHELRSLVAACTLDTKKYAAHDEAANTDFQKIVRESGHITVSQMAEIFERHYTLHEMAFMLGNVAALRMAKLNKALGELHNTAMMFG